MLIMPTKDYSCWPSAGGGISLFPHTFFVFDFILPVLIWDIKGDLGAPGFVFSTVEDQAIIRSNFH